jgi:hypothetical protein
MNRQNLRSMPICNPVSEYKPNGTCIPKNKCQVDLPNRQPYLFFLSHPIRNQFLPLSFKIQLFFLSFLRTFYTLLSRFNFFPVGYAITDAAQQTGLDGT